MSFLTTKEWIPFCVASDNIMHPALLFPFGMSFLTTKEVMTFSLASAAIFCCLYVFSDYKRVDSILFCIRQHHASGTVISFWYVFSDYKGGDYIFTCIRHHFLLLCMSFLTTKERVPFFLGVRSLPRVDLGACGFSAPAFGKSSPL